METYFKEARKHLKEVDSEGMLMTADLTYDTDTSKTGTIGAASAYSYYNYNKSSSYGSDLYTYSAKFTLDDGTVYYGMCAQPSLTAYVVNSSYLTGRSIYKYNGDDYAFIVSILTNWFINGGVKTLAYSGGTINYKTIWGSQVHTNSNSIYSIWDYIQSDSADASGAYSMMHEVGAYFVWGTAYSAFEDGSYTGQDLITNTTNTAVGLAAIQYTASVIADWVSDSSNTAAVNAILNTGAVYVFHPKTESYQDYVFVVTDDTTTPLAAATVNLTITTYSSNSSLTSGNSNYSLTGKTFGVYETKSDADAGNSNYIGTVAVDSTGTGSIEVDANNTYYVREISTGTGYTLNTTTYTVEVEEDDVPVSIPNTPITGSISVTKSSSNTTITSGNSNYSLAGTEIGIWTKQTDATNGDTSASSYVGKITTDSSGNGSISGLALGTYYLREIKAGTGYSLNTSTVRSVSLTSSSTSGTASFTNTPNTASAYVTKTSSGYSNAVSNAASGAYNLAGTVITIYSDSARTKSVGTLTVSYDSSTKTYKSSTLSGLAINTTYYWKETTTGTGYNNSSNLNKTGSFTTGGSGTTTNISISNTPTVRYVRFTKSIASGSGYTQSYSTIVSQGGDGNYSFTGAVITLYTDSACTNVYTTATITSSGYSDYVAIPVGTTLYYKETTAPTGYKLNSTVYTISASTTANTTTATALLGTISETPTYINLRIHKTVDSSYSSWNVGSNSCYSLVGTTFGVYTSAANARSDTNRLGTLTVGSDGYTNYISLARNTTYYIKELSAGTGFVEDDTVYQVTTYSGTSSTVTTVQTQAATISNVPGNDPLTITLTKTGYDGTAQKSLAGAVFSVTYYAGYYTSESAAIAAGVESRTWYLQTVETASGVYRASFEAYDRTTGESSFLSSISDTLYYNTDGDIVVPYGTLVIKEVTAADGYLNDPNFKDSAGNEYGETYVVQAGEDAWISVKTGNTLTDAVSVTDTLIPEIETHLTSTTGLTESKAQASTSTTLTDTVSLTYLNDFVGEEVTIYGVLCDTDGEPIIINGSQVTTSQTVRITGTEQTVIQTFTFDASSLDGQEVVAYEYFLFEGETITEHTDNWDEDQIVWFEPLGPGSISVTKTDSEGKALKGVTYLLEYSTDDGTSWTPVYTYTDGPTNGYVEGGCDSDGLTDGKLTTDDDGLVTFSGLYADGSIMYRLTEVETVDGYSLLAVSVYEGTLYVMAEDIDTTIYDVNGDGDITYADYRYLYNYVNNSGSAPANGTGDINKDGRINASDVTAIKAFLDDWTSGDTPFNRQFDIAYLVKDGSVFDMPLTGGGGTNWVPFVLAGMLLGVMAGGAVFVLKRKKKDDELPTA